MLKKELTGNIQIADNVADWEVAIKLASKPLLEKEQIEERYVVKMIDNLKELGPYVVLMPGVAMPHSRPEHGVAKTCLSLLKLNEGVSFSPKKDDVNLVFILAAENDTSHVDMITQLTDLLEDEERVESIMNASTVDEIYSLV